MPQKDQMMTAGIRSILLTIGSGLAGLLGYGMLAVTTSGMAGLSGVRWEERIEVASGEAYKGPWRMNKSEFHYVDDPTVAITLQGAVGIAWVDQSRKDIFFQVYEPDGKFRIQEPVNVSRSPDIFSWLPKMVLTSDDPSRVYILWQEIVFSGGTHGGEIFFARSTDGGKTFSQPINLSNTIAGAGKGRLTRDYWHNGSLDIAMSPQQGILYAAWTEYEGVLRFCRSTDGGQSFSEPLRIWGGMGENPARGPSLAVGSEGAVYLAWTVGEDKAADIHFTQSADHGRLFVEPRIVAQSDGHADAPKIAVDQKGTVHLVYAESPEGPFERYHIRYSRLEGGKGSFIKPREIARPKARRWKSLNFPGLSLHGKDSLFVIWELFPKPKSYPQGLGFTYSTDGGRTFASPAEISGSLDSALGSSGGRQGLLMRKLAVNANGAIAVAHSTFKRNKSSHIWLLRGQAAWR